MSMSKKSKAKPVDRAEPTIKQAMVTDAQKVAVASAITASMAKSPLWASSPDVQAAAKAWSASAISIGTTAALISDLKNQLAAAEAVLQGDRRTYRACKRQVLSTVSIVCAGSADNVKGFSFDVITRVPASLLAAVEGVTSSPPAACTRTKYTLGGLAPSGSSVFFRVAAIDPLAVTGQSPWSAWVAATVR